MNFTEPIRDKKDIQRICAYLIQKGNPRNHLLFVVCVCTALRIGDVLRLCWEDVYDFETGQMREKIELVEHKTGKSKSIALNKAIVNALNMFPAEKIVPGKFLFESRKTKKAISRSQAHRIVSGAAKGAGMLFKVSCHSLRKVLGYHAWKAGKPMEIIMAIYNHTSYAVTKRYLGISQDEKDDVYLTLDFGLDLELDIESDSLDLTEVADNLI